MWVSSISRESFRLAAFAGLIGSCVALMTCFFAPTASGAPAATKGYIVVLEDDVAHPASLAHRHEDNRGAEVEHVYKSAIKGYSADLTSGEVQAIKQDPNVDYVEPDHAIHTYAQYPSTAIPRIGALGNPQLDIDEKDDAPIDADIAILDTGVALHRDLNIAGRTECLGGGYTGSCVDGTGYPGSEGHGTHVAGIAGARDNPEGVVGSAPGARIWSVRVLGEDGGGSLSDEIAGIDWVTARAATIEVANMSLGDESELAQVEHDALSASIDKGVVYTVSAGNDQHDADLNSPASDPQVITVSAITDYDGAPGNLTQSWCGQLEIDDAFANYSNFGAVIDIAAPGTCIRSTWLNGQYAWRETNDELTNMSGTSMAAPLVAGAAAVMASQANPENRSDVEGIRNALRWQGSFNWTDDSGDGIKEPLLNMRGYVRRSAIPIQAPSVTTTANPAVGYTTATLDGWFNPNGFDTRYYFQYGTSTAYGTTIPAMPGSGIYSGSVPVHIDQQLYGLQAGTTYHYRLVAWNEGGTTYGADQAFTTLVPKPEVSTEGVEAVDSQGATLRGAVNPKGFDTRYQFQYGTTTAYGFSTPEGKAGTGTAPLQLSETISGLAQNTTYHYRLIAWNAGGYTYGADRTFTTQVYQATSTWSLRVPSTASNGWQWVFYRGAGGQLTERYYNGSSWQTLALPGVISSGSTPAAVRLPTDNPNDNIWVFYRNSAGNLAVTYYAAGVWTAKDLGSQMSPGSSPSVLRSPSTDPGDRIWVFTNGGNGKLNETYYAGGGWAGLELGTQMSPGSSPSAVRAPTTDPNGFMAVFTNGSNGKLSETYYAGTGWANLELGAQMSPGSSPSAVRAPTTSANGFMAVFTNGANGKLSETYYAGTGWAGLDLGTQMAPGTSPSAVRAPTTASNAYMAVFTQGIPGPNNTPGRLFETYYAGSGWAGLELGVQMKAGTSPSAQRANTASTNGSLWTFVNGSGGNLTEAYYLGGGWASLDLGVPMLWF